MPQHLSFIRALAIGAACVLTSCSDSTHRNPAVKLTFASAPENASAGSPMPAIRVLVQDADGNTVTGSTVLITVALGTNPRSATLQGTTSVAASNGDATFGFLRVDVADTYTLTASAAGLTQAVSGTFAVTPLAPRKIDFLSQPPNGSAGAAFSPSVRVAVLDTFNNVTPTASGNVTITMGFNPGLGTLSGTKTVTLVNGVASFPDLRLDKAGTNCTVIAQYSTFPAVVSVPFSIVAGAPWKVKFVSPIGDGVSGSPLGSPVHVSVFDSLDNQALAAANQITISIGANPGTATLAGTVTQPAFAGHIAFSNLSINKAGVGYTLLASSTGLQTATSNAFTISSGPAAKLALLDQPQSNLDVGVLLPAIRVAVQDSAGNLVTNTRVVTVSATATDGGTLVGVTSVNTAIGIATFDSLRANRPGALVMTASATGLVSAVSSPFSGRQEFVRITMGGSNFGGWDQDHSCSLNSAGVAHCWGGNVFGELGNAPNNAQALEKQPVLVATLLRFADISAGNKHTCAVTVAGAGWCWGSNSNGRLGDGTSGTKSTPSPVQGSLHFVTISAGGEHTCGITSSGTGVLSGPAYCWGRNDDGQLGDGTFNEHVTPVAVSGGLTFASISASTGSHTCGITTDSLTYCWGLNGNGQLGDNSTSTHNVPTLITNSSTYKFVTVTTGSTHTCAIQKDSTTYCWGADSNDQIGDGNAATTDRKTPSLVTAAFASIAAGWLHNCGVSAGTVKCWGFNGTGQLGDGTATQHGAPAAVSGSASFTQVQSGRNHSCGITVGKTAYCWGNNASGQLGDGSVTERRVPTPLFP